jgi:hypothetical protein
MTQAPFLVLPTKHYERLARVLFKRQPKFAAVQETAVEILGRDPTNRSGSHDIKKLTDVARGEGQWRIAIGRYRFRYDLYDQDVVLH